MKNGKAIEEIADKINIGAEVTNNLTSTHTQAFANTFSVVFVAAS